MAGPRVIIIGAGPAGVRCAETLVAAGIRPTIIDEGRRDGGQIYRRQPDNFTRSYSTLYGTEAAKAAVLHSCFDALRERVDYLPETLVWNISERVVYALRLGKLVELPFDALVLCTGATDRLMPVKGWNFAGTYSLGGAQVALKSQACAIGRRTAFIGTGPLLYLVAAQYLKAGAGVAAVLDTSPWSLRLAALPKLLAMPRALFNGMALTLALRRAGVPMYNGVTPLEITGSGEGGVSGLSFKDARGQAHSLACDAVALGYHLRPETQLADLARCEFQFDAATRQWLPRIDPDGRSSVHGVYLAGDGARILGANAAEASGRLAALAVLKDSGHPVETDVVDGQRRILARLERFAQGLRQSFPWPAHFAANLPDDAVVCRCEAVTVGELRRVVAQTGATESNRAKAFSRVGMGRCQGRYCGNAAAEIIAHAADVPIDQVGRLRGQAPVKPLPIAIAEDGA
ncbi:MAG: NAD(P)/FAD-dependent oxidoreductase [Proteobacteria bacterium]|nr:NAD(P)/FAD-dependent oxidoreductase [Pseudomonadota bacterium]